ncbi:MAG TPA: EAL domain-containing protein [Burkholderiaceae bacterium]|jgi:diguanylate cyclase (GGDEF)-like protein/PAS domain S-box-containing protein
MQAIARFKELHLHDYNVRATRFWTSLSVLGAVALLTAFVQLAQMPVIELAQIGGWLALVLLAAAFPIEIPRTRLSIAMGDVLIFLMLAMFGVAPAVLASTAEGFFAAMRGSARWSSRIGTAAACAVGMSLAGLAHFGAQVGLTAAGLPDGAVLFISLVISALVYFPAQTLPMLRVFYLKRELSMRLRDWFDESAWVGAVYLISALVAGLLALNELWYGRWVAPAVVLTVGLGLVMLRTHFAHQAREQAQQDARLAAAEEEAQAQQRRFHAAFSHAAIGMAVVTREGKLLQANQALCALMGRPPEALLGMDLRRLLHAGDVTLLQRHIDALLAGTTESFSTELRCLGALRDDGARDETWVSLHCAPFEDEAGHGAGMILQLHDISQRRQAEGQLLHIAYHDGLTDLANRTCFIERLQVAAERCRLDHDHHFAVMYMDLDRFKMVNDSLGHPAGDQMLKIVGQRLLAKLRPQDLLARLGGDEFAILIEDQVSAATVVSLGERLLATLREPLLINGTEVQAGASMGLTFSDAGYREPDEILRDADLAMYKAKADGKGRLAMFDSSLHEQIGQKLQLESDLRRAIGEGQLSLAYQPLFELEPYRLTGFEALARWVHPQRGAISPTVFIALAEETGCIESLTAWAIDEATRQLSLWRASMPGAQELLMHVNVSGRDLAQPAFVPHVRGALRQYQVPGELLVLEITESTLMEHREQALAALAELRTLGVKLGIDDFGTGYSSLAYLSTLPFDCLKIDRSFVIGMERSEENLEIVRTVISLGRTLKKHVVAEGIETYAQLRQLKELGATIGQGYLLARPLTPIQIDEMLRLPVLQPS